MITELLRFVTLYCICAYCLPYCTHMLEFACTHCEGRPGWVSLIMTGHCYMEYYWSANSMSVLIKQVHELLCYICWLPQLATVSDDSSVD